jgi:hypothetical protein
VSNPAHRLLPYIFWLPAIATFSAIREKWRPYGLPSPAVVKANVINGIFLVLVGDVSKWTKFRGGEHFCLRQQNNWLHLA